MKLRPRAPALLVLLAAAIFASGCAEGGEGPASQADQTTAAADQQPAGQQPAGEQGPVMVATLGDSITAGSPLWDPDPAVRDQIGPGLDERSQFEYWAAREEPALRFRNCGVFGERSDEIAARLPECAEGADILIVQGGINDIAQGAPVEQAAENLEGIVVTGLDAGLDVAIADVLPWNNGHPAADGPIAELNREIEEIATRNGVPLLPFHDTLEDAGAPGTMQAALTIDGDHPSVEGYRLLAERAVLPELPSVP